MSNKLEYKVLLIGNSQSGKTRWLQSVLDSTTINKPYVYVPTICIDIQELIIKSKCNAINNIKLNIYDTSGNAKYMGNSLDYYHDVDVGIIFYTNVTRPDKWIRLAYSVGIKNLIVVYNYPDLDTKAYNDTIKIPELLKDKWCAIDLKNGINLHKPIELLLDLI